MIGQTKRSDFDSIMNPGVNKCIYVLETGVGSLTEGNTEDFYFSLLKKKVYFFENNYYKL